MGLSEGEIKQRTDDCLKLFGIEKLRERPPYHLSGGEKRKVSLACILSMNPEVLILDEPLAGLDESTQKMLIDFLKKFHAAGKTLIIKMCIRDRVKPGRVMFEVAGVPEETAREALRLAMHKLPVKCKIVSRADLEGGDNSENN